MNYTVKCEITEPIAILSRTASGLTLELNRVSFGGRPAKLDLRKWKNGHPLKGIPMTDKEALALLDVLHQMAENGKRARAQERAKAAEVEPEGSEPAE